MTHLGRISEQNSGSYCCDHRLFMFCAECEIGGAVFLDASEEDWKEFGVSKVGLLRIRRIKEKVCWVSFIL